MAKKTHGIWGLVSPLNFYPICAFCVHIRTFSISLGNQQFSTFSAKCCECKICLEMVIDNWETVMEKWFLQSLVTLNPFQWRPFKICWLHSHMRQQTCTVKAFSPLCCCILAAVDGQELWCPPSNTDTFAISFLGILYSSLILIQKRISLMP